MSTYCTASGSRVLSLALALAMIGALAPQARGEPVAATAATAVTADAGAARSSRATARPRATPPQSESRAGRTEMAPQMSLAEGKSTLMRLPFAASHERLWRDDHVYDIVLITDWNYTHRQRQRGSAIFFHLTEAGERPTQGCIAIARTDMLKLLPRLTPGTRLVLG